MLKDTFCSSPWFHIKIDAAGNYITCRWSVNRDPYTSAVDKLSPVEFMNSDEMKNFRLHLLSGEKIKFCDSCYYEESLGKVTGRDRQLLKSGVTVANFDKTFLSSPHFNLFNESANNSGHTSYHVVDLQLDIGNACNSACIMCSPEYSSLLASDYNKLTGIAPDLFKVYPKYTNWINNDTVLNRFLESLCDLPNLKYIHLLGGETLHLKSFYKICDKLIELGIAKNVTLGTTTNCTMFDKRIEHVISNFKEVHLGISIESVNSINDYVRYPSTVKKILSNLKKFLALRNDHSLQISLRITPNVFTIYKIDELFEFMIKNNVVAESCNILRDPSCLRIEIMPDNIRKEQIQRFDALIAKYKLSQSGEPIINRRSNSVINQVIADLVFEYKALLENFTVPDNVEDERKNLVRFIKSFEEIRNNSILTYIPEYEEFLRSHGY